MIAKSATTLRNASPYNAAITREQFLFYKMRTTAKLVSEGLTEDDAAARIVSNNLFQYPTEKSVRRMALACLRRLKAMNDDTLVQALATQPFEVAKQICLYAMMKQYRLVWDFMVTVVGEKYRSRDNAFSKMDLNVFFLRLQEQDDGVATWSESTIARARQILTRVLVETEYLDSTETKHLNPVWLNPILEAAMRSNHDDAAFSAFNYFT